MARNRQSGGGSSTALLALGGLAIAWLVTRGSAGGGGSSGGGGGFGLVPVPQPAPQPSPQPGPSGGDDTSGAGGGGGGSDPSTSQEPSDPTPQSEQQREFSSLAMHPDTEALFGVRSNQSVELVAEDKAGGGAGQSGSTSFVR